MHRVPWSNGWKLNRSQLIRGLDTRALTRHLRDRGTMLGKIMVEGKSEPEWYDPSTENVVETVSQSDPTEQGFGDEQMAV